MTVNERVRYLRKNVLHLNQAEFGAALHLRQQSICMMETCTGVTDRNIAAICGQWNVRQEWLRTGEGEIFSSRPAPAAQLDMRRLYEVYAALDDRRRALFWQLYEQVAK